MIRHVTAIWSFRHFWMSLVRLDLRNRYRRSVLGIGWSLLHPLAMTVVFCLVFSRVLNQTDWRSYAPFLLAGIGNYTMIADAQVNGKTARQNDMSLSFGGGIWFKLGDRVGVQLDGRAVQYHGYDREFFNPARGRREQLTPFVEDFPKPPAEKTTPMSTTFTLGFRYVPGGGGN